MLLAILNKMNKIISPTSFLETAVSSISTLSVPVLDGEPRVPTRSALCMSCFICSLHTCPNPLCLLSIHVFTLWKSRLNTLGLDTRGFTCEHNWQRSLIMAPCKMRLCDLVIHACHTCHTCHFLSYLNRCKSGQHFASSRST